MSVADSVADSAADSAADSFADALASRFARLQAAAAHDDATPHLLVTNDAGHGIGSSIQQTIEQQADGLGFLVHHLTR